MRTPVAFSEAKIGIPQFKTISVTGSVFPTESDFICGGGCPVHSRLPVTELANLPFSNELTRTRIKQLNWAAPLDF